MQTIVLPGLEFHLENLQKFAKLKFSIKSNELKMKIIEIKHCSKCLVLLYYIQPKLFFSLQK